MTPRDIVFLIYLNRSGSTFLANQLSRHAAVAVAPEGHRALRRLLGQLSTRVPLEARIRRFVFDCETDAKLSSWNVDPGRLRARLSGVEDEVDALYEACEAYADAMLPDARTVMIKGYYLLDLIRRHGFAGLARERKVRAIFLIRDPRAMFASQKYSASTTSGLPMQDNAVGAALRWWQAAGDAIRFARFPQAHLVRYEDLVADNTGTIEALASFLQIDCASILSADAGSGSLHAMLPDRQRSLHQNIARPPIAEKIDAWRNRLSRAECNAIELIAGRRMRKCRYDVPASWRGQLGRVKAMPIAAMWLGRLGVSRLRLLGK